MHPEHSSGEQSDKYIFKNQPAVENEEPESRVVYASGEQDIQRALEETREIRELTHPDPEKLDEVLSKGADPRLLSDSAARELVKLRFHQSVTEFFHGEREEQAILGQEMVEFTEDAFENMGRYIEGAYRFIDLIFDLRERGIRMDRIMESGPGPGVFTHFVAKSLQECQIDAFDISPTSVEEFRSHAPDYTDPNDPNKKYGEQYTTAAINYYQRRRQPYIDRASNNVTVTHADFFQIADHVRNGDIEPYDAHIGRHWAHRPEPEAIVDTLQAMLSAVKRDGGLVYQTLFTKVNEKANLDDEREARKVTQFLKQSASKSDKPHLRASFDAAKFNAPSEGDLQQAFLEIVSAGEFNFDKGPDGLPLTHLVMDDGIGSARVQFVRRAGDNLAGEGLRYGGNA
jgi:hypothetical protein